MNFQYITLNHEIKASEVLLYLGTFNTLLK